MVLEYLIILASITLMLIILPFPPATYVFLAVACTLVSLSSFGVPNILVSGIIRGTAALWLFVALAKEQFSSHKRTFPRGPHLIASTSLFAVLFAVYASLSVWITLANFTAWSDLLERLAGVLIGVSVVLLILQIRTPLLTPVSFALTVFLLASIVLGVTQPESAVVQGRLTGLFANANSTGVAGMSLVIASALRGNISVASISQLILGGAVIVWTASRASAAAAIVSLLMLILLRRNRGGGTRFLILAVCASMALFVYRYVDFASLNLLLFRDTASRFEWQWALDSLTSNPIHGVGDVLTPSGEEVATGVANSFLAVGALGGGVGLAALIVVLGILWKSALTAGPRTTIVLVGFLLHSFLESWLAAPGSPVMILFFFLFFSAMQIDIADRKPDHSHGTLHSDMFNPQSVGDGPSSFFTTSSAAKVFDSESDVKLLPVVKHGSQ